MGVHGLWELLAPVGRRVSVETLAGKKLAIDASIWMIQFMKAMRDEKGEMVRNAHILGFFRRICKLLFLRTKPVFVFDGGTPALKRRTVIARRRQRENAQAKIRKTAEKLLLNHLKAMRLKELAEDLEKQRKQNDIKGKGPIVDESNNVQQTEKGNDDAGIVYNQEELDAMLAASLAAEENEGFGADASTSGVGGAPDDEVYVGGEDDEDEEMILPEMHGKVDPAVLAALPPSMQLDLLAQMRERLMAENRQKYQKVKKAPERFSELQIQSYLKTVAFRREIDGVQKAAAGRGIGGMQTSRIASEANREFIFSSSFTGDKQAFTSVAQEEVQAGQSQPPPVNEVLPTKRSGGAARPAVAETEKEFHDDVETYVDERGRLRVSRVRALGIRMTRDLQRNLDLMKEIDREKVENNQENNNEPSIQHQDITNKSNNVMNDDVDKPEAPAFVNGTSIEISFEDAMEDEVGNEDDELFASLVAGDQETDFPAADIFVSAKQSSLSASDCEWEEGVIENKRTSNIFEEGVNDGREVEWEEGFQEGSVVKTGTKGDLQEEAEIQEAIRRSLGEGVIEDKSTSNMFEEGMNDEREVEWEEGFQDKSVKTVTKGDSQEEADFHEAIRRSLDGTVSQSEKEIVNEGADMLPVCEGKEGLDVGALATSVSHSHDSSEIPEMNCSVAKSATFIELSPDTSDLKSGKSDLDPGNSKTDPRDMLQKELDDPHSHDAGNSGKISAAFTELSPDKSNLGPDNRNTDLQDTSLEELDNDHSCYSELGKVSADAVTKNVNSAKEPAEEETYGHLLKEKEKIMTNTSLMDDTEQEMMKDYLEEEILYLGKEREELGSEQRKLERNAESVNSEMFAECQELLQMFGLPYIIAPMEAEAQCAFMELSNLVDGVVTDDSDAFLFGARSVYKNIFDDRKYVETYLMKDIEDELGLDREKLIRMALLLGSDYTEGISGIGIVNAIEVVNAFPEKNGLCEFREWIESPDPTILGKVDGDSRKRGSKGSENIPEDVDKRIKQIFMDKHRNVSKNWHIPSTFPSDAVISAYDSPQVDKSTETFSWGKPDLFILRKLCWEKFGWNTSKTDELLVPVLKEYNKHETQLRLEAFYTFNEKFAKIRSKRIKKALKGITGHKSSESLDGTTSQQIQSGKKRKVKPSQVEVNPSGVDSAVGISNEDSNKEKPNDKQLRRGGVKKPKTSLGNVEKSSRNRGRGRGQVNGKGRKKMESPSADSDSDEEMELLGPEESPRVRRSARAWKTVNYNVSDEFDYCDEESENLLKEGPTANPSCPDTTGGGLNESDKNKACEGMRPLMDTAIPGLNESDKNKACEGMKPLMDTAIPGPIDINPIEDHPKLPNDDYLQFGGGFCVDDEEDDKKQASSPTRETIPDVSDDFYLTADDITPDPANGGNLPDKKLAMSLDDPEGIDPTNAASKSLRAMPNLRRKRRKT